MKRALLDPELLRPPEVAKFLGIGRTTLYKLRRADPTFPRSIRLLPNCVRWRRADLVKWSAAKPDDDAA